VPVIAVVREEREGEARVAVVPELVGKLTGLGYSVVVEPGPVRLLFGDAKDTLGKLLSTVKAL
jgi:NAD/NADP transhydrogenase alpha subunit